MAVKIITDSTCDLSALQKEQLGVTVLPLSVYFGNDEYRDGVDITPSEFFEKLESMEDGKLPTTSQVNPAAFEAAFRSATENGDQAVGIFISSRISGTYQSACIARDTVSNGRIFVVDSKVATMGLALMVQTACRMRDEGAGAAEIAQRLTQLSDRVRFICVVDTLKYLRMGGRISSVIAGIGGVLDLKPVVVMTQGIIKAVDVGKGHKRAVKKLLSLVEKDGPDFSMGTSAAHSAAPALFEDFLAALKDRFGELSPLRIDLGAAIGVYAGPGCVGLSYFSGR